MSTLVEQTKARKDYHAKWDAIAKEEVQRVKDEDALDKQASSLSLGTDSGPKSEAEAKDKATNKALREAKALWEKRRDEESKQKLIIKGETKTVLIDQKMLGDALVVDIQECKKAVVTLVPGLKVAKVFISQCEDVVVELRCPLITSFVEVSRCTKTTLITSKVLHTVQCDLCDDCSIIWATKECFHEAQDPGSRVYSAACRRLGVAVGGRQNSMRVEVDNFDRSLCDENIPIEEQQFVTFQASHMRRISYVVGPLMLLEAATAVWLRFIDLPGPGTQLAWIGMGLVLLLWLSTLILQVPCHWILERGWDAKAHHRLVMTNWLRTVAWTGRAVIAVWMLML